jgi:hypothetical protein
MSSECYEVSVSTNAPISTIIFSTGSSLIDMLNQQSYPTINEDTNLHNKQVQNSRLDQSNNICEHDKLSTLFNTTGRERNSTGPLKQWLYEHQDHPCK